MLQLFNDKVKEICQAVENKYAKANKIDRFEHILGVCEMATTLAIKYNVDVFQAQVAALLHDYYKYESNQELAKLLTEEERKECEKCKILYHSYASSKALKYFDINDDMILSAVKNHVFGHDNMTKLEEIILISDYIERTRKYPDCIFCRELVEKGLFDLAIYRSTKNTIEKVIKEHGVPHPMQIKVLNKYERKAIMDKIKVAIEALGKVNATDIVCYDTNALSPFFSNVVVASVDSVRQLNAVLNYLKEGFALAQLPVKSTSGANTEWVILDGCDILVHVFYKEERIRFDIDKLYIEAPKVDLSQLV